MKLATVFFGTRCQGKVPVRNTSATRTLGAGIVTLMKVTNTFARIVLSELHNLARRLPTPSCPHFLNIFQASS